MHVLVCQHISMMFTSVLVGCLRPWIKIYSRLFSLEQGRTNEAVECTEGSVILWFEAQCPACWFLLGLVECSSLMSAVMEKILAIRSNFAWRILYLSLWGLQIATDTFKLTCYFRTIFSWFYIVYKNEVPIHIINSDHL